MLFMHGFLILSEQSEDLINLLQLQYNVLAVDLPGFGLSDLSDDYHVDTLLSYIIPVLKHLNWQTFSIVGQSMGGQLAIEIPANKQFQNYNIENVYSFTPSGLKYKTPPNKNIFAKIVMSICPDSLFYKVLSTTIKANCSQYPEKYKQKLLKTFFNNVDEKRALMYKQRCLKHMKEFEWYERQDIFKQACKNIKGKIYVYTITGHEEVDQQFCFNWWKQQENAQVFQMTGENEITIIQPEACVKQIFLATENKSDVKQTQI